MKRLPFTPIPLDKYNILKQCSQHHNAVVIAGLNLPLLFEKVGINHKNALNVDTIDILIVNSTVDLND